MNSQKSIRGVTLFVAVLTATILFVGYLMTIDGTPESSLVPDSSAMTTGQGVYLSELQASDNVNPVSIPIDDVDGQGNTAYVAMGGRIQVYEVSDNEPVVCLDRTARYWSSIASIELKDDKLYVAGWLSAGPGVQTGPGQEAISVLDVSDPSDIQWSGSINISGRVTDLHIDGNIMLAANEETGAVLYDVASAAILAPIATLPVAAGGARRGMLADDIAYVIVDDSLVTTPSPPGSSGGGSSAVVGPRVMLWDVSSLTAPVLLSSILIDSSEAAIDVVDNDLYIAMRDTMRVYGVQNLTSPVLAHTVPLHGQMPSDVIHNDERLYVSVILDAGELTDTMIWTFDLSAPGGPEEIGSHYVDDAKDSMSAVAMEWVANRLLVATTDGLEVARWLEPDGLVVVSAPRLSRGWLSAVVADQDNAFIADEFQGLRILDIQDPSEPTQISRVATVAGMIDLVKQGDYVYAMSDYELFVFDVQSVNSPTLVAREITLEQDGYGMNLGIEVYEDMLFISGLETGISVYDISVPSAPEQLESLEIADYATYALLVDGHYLYAGNTSHFVVYNLDGVLGPEMIDEVEHEGGIVSMAKIGHHVVTSDIACDYQVFDVSDPADVEFVTSRVMGTGQTIDTAEAIANFPNTMTSFGGYVLSATYGTDRPLRITDLANPSNPVETGGYVFKGVGRDVHVIGSQAIVSFGEVLHIIDIANPKSPTLLGMMHVEG